MGPGVLLLWIPGIVLILPVSAIGDVNVDPFSGVLCVLCVVGTDFLLAGNLGIIVVIITG